MTENERLYVGSKILKKSKAYLLANSCEVTPAMEKISEIYIKNKKPLSKIFKEKFFWNWKFFVNNHVLDPRPHTEDLIELLLKNHHKEESFSFLDLGTGSGVIACTIGTLFPNSTGIALDICKKALRVAHINLKRFKLLDRIKIVQSDWLSDINYCFNILVSNPPYLTVEEAKNLHFEPLIALTAGENENILYEKISAKSYLFEEIYLEVPPVRKKEIKEIFSHHKLYLV